MIDKEKLLKIKDNMERMAKVCDIDEEEAKEDQEYYELMLSLVNKELQLIEEEETEALGKTKATAKDEGGKND
jgi:hypothetical protein